MHWTQKWQVDLEFVSCGGLAILFCWDKVVCVGPANIIIALRARMQGFEEERRNGYL